MLLGVWGKAVYFVRGLGEGGVCSLMFGGRRCILLGVWGKAVYFVRGLGEGGVFC